MEDKEILKAVANTITDAPLHTMVVPVRVPVLHRHTLWDRILRKPSPIPETQRTITFYPSVVANQYRIAGEASLLPDEIYQDGSMNIPLIKEHLPRIIYMIAAAIQNNHLEPDPELITFLEQNLTGSQMREALVASFQTLNMEAFTDTIILMKGTVKILMPTEVSPKDGSELIASHTETY